MTRPISLRASWSALIAYAVALVAPPLCAFSFTPSPTLLNQLLAIGGWGLCLAIHASPTPMTTRPHATGPLVAGLGLVAAGVVASWTFGSLPTSLALPPLALVLLAGVVAVFAARIAQEPADGDETRGFAPFAIWMAGVGLASALISIVQVFWPDLPDGNFFARSGLPGRAVGNLRQPNHLASLLIWSVIAWVPLIEWRLVPRWLGGFGGALAIFGVILSGSRTGLYGGLAILVLWGALDGRLSKSTRLMLVATPLAAAVFWFGLAQWSEETHGVFAAKQRLSEGDSSHGAIWSNALDMIRQQPLLGVGWGEFNFAWTLTPFPHRPTAFFDHTHDLPLQLAVEFGVPAALVILGLLLWAVVQGARRAWATPGPAGHGARAAWVMVVMIGLHSLDEYPLWYAYFLFPAAWAFGFTLGSGPTPRFSGAGTDSGAVADQGTLVRRGSEGVAVRWLGGLMIVAALVAAWDYHEVATIFDDKPGLPSLADRIARGQRSPVFAHHADYADATTADPPSHALGALERATHSLIDTRLMIAWANALAESGQVDRARYVADRLREFRKDDAADFFAPCTDPQVADKPFQCQSAPAGLSWRDLR